MTCETATARVIQRIAIELGVPLSSFYDQRAASPSDHEAMQKAVSALLSAFAVARDPDERQRCVALLGAEAKRLRDLAESDDG